MGGDYEGGRYSNGGGGRGRGRGGGYKRARGRGGGGGNFSSGGGSYGSYGGNGNGNSYANSSKSYNYGSSSHSRSDFKSVAEMQQERLTDTLFRLGDQKIVEWASIVHEIDTEIQNGTQDSFFSALETCVTKIPLKIPHYALLTGLLNVKNFDLGVKIIQRMGQALNEKLQKDDFVAAKLLIRYFACCLQADVIMPNQLISLFDSFLAVQQEIEVRAERSDVYTYLVMTSLPWAASTLRDRNLFELERIYQVLEDYMRERPSALEALEIPFAQASLSIYRDSIDDIPYNQVDFLDLIWFQMQDLKRHEWVAGILANPFKIMKEKLHTELKPEIPTIVIPTSVSIVKFIYQPKFWIFNDGLNVSGQKAMSHLPSAFSVNRFILDDIFTDTIRIFSLNHTECTTLLLNSERFLNGDFIAKHDFQVYEAVVESIFSELLHFPKTMDHAPYYNALIIDLCRESLDKIPSILGRSFKLLYNRLDGSNKASGMDVEGIKRFAEFFSIHLSNFGFSWKWQDWVPIVKEEGSQSARFVFVREVFEKCIRLSYFARIKDNIPEAFARNPEIFPAASPTFVYRYLSAESCRDEGLFDLVRELNSKLSLKEESSSVRSQLEEINEYALSHATIFESYSMSSAASEFNQMPSPGNISHDALFQCIMHQGHKSFSHLLNVIENYIDLLQDINISDASKTQTTESIFAFWQQNSQFLEIILGKLINYRVIDSKAVLKLVLSVRYLDFSFDRFYIWAIVTSTLKKACLKAEQIAVQVKIKKEKPDQEIEMNDDAQLTLSDMERALESAEKEKKDLFVLVFSCFVDVLSEKLSLEGASATNTPFWRWVSGQMRNIGREFQPQVLQNRYTIEANVFQRVEESQIKEIWKGLNVIYSVQQ